MQLKIPFSLTSVIAAAFSLLGCTQSDEKMVQEPEIEWGEAFLPLALGNSCNTLAAGECYHLRGVIRVYADTLPPELIAEIPTPDGQYTTPADWKNTSGLPLYLEVGDYFMNISYGEPCDGESLVPPLPDGDCYRLYDCTAAGAGWGIGGVRGCTLIQNEAEPLTEWPDIPFTVTEDEPASIQFSFQFGDQILDFGYENLKVSFQVTKLTCPPGQVSTRLNNEEMASCRYICLNNSQCEEGFVCVPHLGGSEALEPGEGYCAENPPVESE